MIFELLCSVSLGLSAGTAAWMTPHRGASAIRVNGEAVPPMTITRVQGGLKGGCDVSPLAEQAATGTVSVICIPWSFPSNRIDWLFNPTKARGPFNPEWTWQLNRMNFWECLAEAYRTTGDEKYAQAFAVQFRDWFVQTGGVPPERGYNAIGSPWRTLEEGLRLMGSWPMAEDAFRDSPAFTPELKRQFVATMRAQAKHLMAHKTGLNWLISEMRGVYTFAARHPEFPESEGWRRDSARIFVDEIRRQILPDGMQVELSPDYHQVCFKSAVKLYRLARAHGFEKDLPKDYLSVLERGAQAVLDMTTPSLVQPRFNDCYTIPAKWTLEIAAELFPQREDFKWAASGRRVDTTNVTVSADGRSALADYGVGRKWNLSLKAVEGGKISLASGQMKPRLSGWFVGHANLTVHPATTISVKAPAPTREHRFATELLPVAAK